MKKILIGILVIVITGFAVYRFYKFIGRIDTADPEYNTIYTKGYKEKGFNTNLIGLTESQITNVLGEPFSKTKLEYFNAILYTNRKDSLYLNENSISIGFLRYSDSINYRFISFDSSGNVGEVMIKGYPETKEEIEKLTKSAIIRVLGNPDKEMLCDCKCEVYSYSEIKKGSYSGKHPIINLRNIVFDNNKIAIKIIKKVQNTYSKYDGICTEK